MSCNNVIKGAGYGLLSHSRRCGEVEVGQTYSIDVLIRKNKKLFWLLIKTFEASQLRSSAANVKCDALLRLADQ